MWQTGETPPWRLVVSIHSNSLIRPAHRSCEMNLRRWIGALLAVLAITPIPGIVAAMHSVGQAEATVCVGAGRRVSVSGCANVADAIQRYVPPPADYAPMPEDPPP